MALFGRHKHSGASSDTAPGPQLPAMPGWSAAPDRPFDGHLEDAVAEIDRVRHGASRGIIDQAALRVGTTVFRDAFRTTVEGRRVTVANAWTDIRTEVRFADESWHVTSVVAVELPALVPLRVCPHGANPWPYVQVVPTGDPAFDKAYDVTGTPEVTALFTDSVRSAILVHDDWYFYAERYLLGCAGAGAFSSIEQVNERVGEVLAVVAGLPVSLVPTHVDHSADELVARAMALTSMEEGLAFLQGLTPEERDLLAHSDTPLAALADVQSPQEAMARFKTLDPAAKSQLMAQFMRVKDNRRGR